ncbi:MAG: 16S rRNA (uracil(1498)-N(3))-methyltransferase [Actinobacteria bacterium]|nr:16S rRNA (uracil(1498)-N(3))-methyltransferase [Actinomycetota bacterium]
MERVAAHLFVADLERPEVADEDRHHLERVLRLRAGETVTVSDGRGGHRRCILERGLCLAPAAETVRVAAPAPTLAVGFALVKGGRPEWMVQKLTECGIDRVVPFLGARSVVRWEPERAGKQLVRLRRIAREAAMQCRRVRLPVVEPVTDLATLAATEGQALAMADIEGEPPGLERPFVLVGPEGGWGDDERAVGLARVCLGPHVLRAETAAVAAGVLLSALRAGLVASRS